ncbi:MAG: 50S ribosomal protein L10 [Clostridia bacterium]
MSTAIRQQKEKQVEDIIKQFSEAKSFVLVDYKGLTVAQDTELRRAFRNAGVNYHVMKNRLVKIALNKMGFTEFDEALKGPTSVAMAADDLSAPARITVEKSNAFKKMAIKCGMADGLFLDEEGCKVLAKLPSREILIAQLLGMLQAPIASFARAIDAIAQQKA